MMRILVYGDRDSKSARLASTLVANGMSVVGKVSNAELIPELCKNNDAELLVLDVARPDDLIVNALRSVLQTQPKPVVMFADDTDAKSMETVVRAGVHAFVVNGFDELRLMNIINTAVIRFKETEALRNELIKTKLTLVERKDIERAKGILMRQRDMDEEQAYKTMRQVAMNQNKKMIDVARSIIDVSQLLN